MRFVRRVYAKYVVAVNTQQLEHAKHGIEGIGFYDIPIDIFLDLTTESELQKRSILEETKKLPPKPEWETSIIHPFIYVDENGNIDGHEGRHRAATAFNQGQKRFRIVIAARDGGWDHKKWGWRWKRQLQPPPVLRGQFRPFTHKIDMNNFELIKRSVG